MIKKKKGLLLYGVKFSKEFFFENLAKTFD